MPKKMHARSFVRVFLDNQTIKTVCHIIFTRVKLFFLKDSKLFHCGKSVYITESS